MSFSRFSILVLLVLPLALLGCNREKPREPVAQEKKHDHSDWWCEEHGVPEAECALCNKKVAAEFRKNGDWCDKHNRPDSQCFICHPENEAKFAARYEAKYGKKPPKRTQVD
jgi:cobalt-zinc-cadmium efflux system membrane fusion protein